MKFIKKIKPFHVDERGEMFYLLDKSIPITSVLYITCKKGAVRANHYHKKDTHYSYMVNGSMEYTYKEINPSTSSGQNSPLRQGSEGQAKLKTIIVSSGEIVETPPMTVHAMRFLEDSIFIALTTEARNQKKYEKDTVRVKLI